MRVPWSCPNRVLILTMSSAHCSTISHHSEPPCHLSIGSMTTNSRKHLSEISTMGCAKEAEKASCGEMVVQKGALDSNMFSINSKVFRCFRVETVRGREKKQTLQKHPFWTTVFPHDAFSASLAQTRTRGWRTEGVGGQMGLARGDPSSYARNSEKGDTIPWNYFFPYLGPVSRQNRRQRLFRISVSVTKKSVASGHIVTR